jgi:hypothetical protein
MSTVAQPTSVDLRRASQIDRLITSEVAPHLDQVRNRIHEAVSLFGSWDVAVSVWTDDGRGLVAKREGMQSVVRKLGAPEDIVDDLKCAAPPGHVFVVIVGSQSIALALLHMLPLAESGAA